MAIDKNNILTDEALTQLYKEMMLPRSILHGKPMFSDSAECPEAPSFGALRSAREEVTQWLITMPGSVPWSSVIGNEGAKAELRDAITARRDNANLYSVYGLTPPKGVLLYGPPGCGKTMLAKAAATELGGEEFILLNGSSLTDFYLGETEKNLRRIFDYARAYEKAKGKKLLIFVDEAETLFPQRGSGYRWQVALMAEALSALDGVKSFGGFLILATNRPQDIDEAFLREGRCDRKIKVVRPSFEDMRQIIALNLKGVPCDHPATDLVETAVECLYDPSRIIHDQHITLVNMDNVQEQHDIGDTFRLEHIVSGAMAAAVVSRAKLEAFRRDREADTLTGLRVGDIIEAVNLIFEENKGFRHDYAFEEFRGTLEDKAKAKITSLNRKGKH